jgi:hypothetical protein
VTHFLMHVVNDRETVVAYFLLFFVCTLPDSTKFSPDMLGRLQDFKFKHQLAYICQPFMCTSL